MPPNPKDIIWDSPAPTATIDPSEIVWDQPKPVPTMGQVALNAIPRGLANVANTPQALVDLAAKGLASLPYAGHFKTLQQNAIPQPNAPMEVFEKLGLVDPNKNPVNAQQRIVDAAIQGGVGVGLSPAGSAREVIKNILMGMTSGGAGQATTEATGSPMAGMAVSLAAPLAVRSTARPEEAKTNAARDLTLKQGQQAGYVLPATEVNPSWTQSRLESIGGKAALKQEAVGRNQAVTTRLAAEDLGIPKTTPLTETTLANARKEAGQIYEQAKQLRPTQEMEWFPRYHEKNLVEQMKQARADASGLRKSLLTKNDPAMMQHANELEGLADSLQSDIGRLAKANGKEEIIDALAKARVKIAKIHDVENVTSQVGEVSAPMIGSLANKQRLSGNLELIGRYQQAFPKFMGEGAKSPTPGVSAVEPMAMTGLGMGGAALAESPAGWLAAGIPLVRGPVRSALLSKPYQRFFAQPDYSGLSAKEKMIQSLLAARMQASAEQ